VPNWKDLNPRLGASYDLFGDGRTALKVTLGRYVEPTGTGIPTANNPIVTAVNSVNRTWNDANRNYIPDCDLRNPAANGECGAFDNQNFGNNNPAATRYADDVLRGFGVRNYLWDISTEVQHQLRPGVSVTGGYYRNWAANFRVTDNLQVTPADYSPYCITAPVDPRLPGGGGYQVCGLYDIAPAKFGLVNNLVTQASNFSGEHSQFNCDVSGSLASNNGALLSTPSGILCGQSDFFGIRVDTRFGSGVQFGAGVDTGRTVIDNCLVVDSPQQLLNCRTVMPFGASTQVKLYASYPLPGDFTVSGTFQNVGGPAIEANYAATNAEIAPSLGRDLAACRGATVCTATATVPLIVPRTLFERRRTQLDLRLSKIFRVGPKIRLQGNFDVYNVLNANSVLGVNANYGRSWLLPTSVSATDALLPGRLLQVGGGLTF